MITAEFAANPAIRYLFGMKDRKPEENPFEDPEVARLWSYSVENDRNDSRDLYIYPLLKEWLSDPAVHSVLDIGAGQGIASQFIADKRYVGVEPSEPLVKRANELYGPSAEFVVGNAYELPFNDASFDAAFAINVWFHLEHPELADRELARILRPDGKFLIINPNPEAYALWETFYDNVKKEGKKFVGEARIPLAKLPKNIFYTHSDDELRESFFAAGLEVEEAAPFSPSSKNGILLFKYYRGRRNR
jgi:SAM-dependent methyltransferase